EDVTVAEQDILKQQLRFSLEGLIQAFEVGKDNQIRLHARNNSQTQPLGSEIGNQTVRAGIGKHSPDLTLKNRGVLKLSAFGKSYQFVVGNTAPKEEREPRSE